MLAWQEIQKYELYACRVVRQRLLDASHVPLQVKVAKNDILTSGIKKVQVLVTLMNINNALPSHIVQLLQLKLDICDAISWFGCMNCSITIEGRAALVDGWSCSLHEDFFPPRLGGFSLNHG
jgi:hypothetical protein